MVSDGRLRVAVVGTGGWARQHARIFAGRADVELCGILGRDEGRTAARAGEFGTRGYTSLERLLEVERPELVSVSLPNEHHFERTVQLVRAGVPLLVEKPLVFDLGEADALLAEAERRALFFAINFNHRYAVPVLRTRAAIETGALGAIRFAVWRFGGDQGTSGHAHANLIETQCHGFDLLEHLCGPIAAVSAEMGCGPPFTTVAVALAFESGAVGTLLGTYDSSYAYPLTHYLEVNGSEGRAFVEDTVRRLRLSRAGSEVAEVWEAGYFNDADRDFHHTFDRHVDAVLDALRTGARPPVHARAGRRALAVAHAVIEAFETGRRVAVEPVGAPS